MAFVYKVLVWLVVALAIWAEIVMTEWAYPDGSLLLKTGQFLGYLLIIAWFGWKKNEDPLPDPQFVVKADIHLIDGAVKSANRTPWITGLGIVVLVLLNLYFLSLFRSKGNVITPLTYQAVMTPILIAFMQYPKRRMRPLGFEFAIKDAVLSSWITYANRRTDNFQEYNLRSGAIVFETDRELCVENGHGYSIKIPLSAFPDEASKDNFYELIRQAQLQPKAQPGFWKA